MIHSNTGGMQFSWDNQQLGAEKRLLARLDRIYTPRLSREDFTSTCYTILGNSLGSDHTPVKLELSIGREERRPTAFKWNAYYLKDSSLIIEIKNTWLSLPCGMPFFKKLRHIARLYR